MSLEAWGDEGNTVDESSYESGRDSMSEDVIDLIDKERDIFKKDLAEVSKMIDEQGLPDLEDSRTRLIQGINALDNIESGVKKV